jgi:uncharacterized membrane protein
MGAYNRICRLDYDQYHAWNRPLRSLSFHLSHLIVSLEAIFLSTFILISQNREKLVSDQRNQLDLQINLLAEQENTKMLTILERIATKVGARTDDDPHLQVLEQATRPEKLVEQIEETIKQNSQTSRQR